MSIQEISEDWERSRFVRVTPLLMKACDHDAVVAMVMAHILYRTFDGEHWWTAMAEEVAEETGLTLFQARRGLRVVRENGWVKSRRVDKWHPTLEWTVARDPVVVVEENPVVLLERHHSDVAAPTSPSIRTIQEEEQEEEQEVLIGELVPIQPKGSVRTNGDGGFTQFWAATVRKVGIAQARKAYAQALAKVDHDTLLTAWFRHNKIWATWPKGEKTFIPHPSTWLNREGWQDDDPEFKGGGIVAEVLAQMSDEDAHKALFGDMFGGGGSQTQAFAAITDTGDTTSHLEGR